MQAHGRGPQGEFEAQYHYDALGRRSRKAVRYKGKTEQTTRFLWQGYRLLQEQRDDGSRRSWSYDPASPWSPLAALEQAGDSRSSRNMDTRLRRFTFSNCSGLRPPQAL